MIRRIPNEAIDDQVDESEGQPTGVEENLDTVCRGRGGLSDRQHAGRNEWAVLAALTFLTVRTARHVPVHSGHIAHLADRQPLRRSRCYQRRSNQSYDRKDREQMTDESAKIHALSSHGIGNLGRLVSSHVLPDS